MTDAFEAGDLAARFAAAHRSQTPVPAAEIGTGPQTVEHAYAVQAAVMREIGANGGFKTSRPDPAAPNVMAPIPAANIRPSPAHYDAAEMRLYGIELEIAFRIDKALPAPGDADYDARLRDAVSAVAAIEMVDTRLADREGASDLVKLADNQSGFGLVVGQPVADFAALNLVDPAITFTVDGEQLGPTAGKIPGSVDAFQVLQDLLAVVGDHCGGVAPGMYVTTGALSGLFWTTKGVTVRGSIAGLGAVEATIGG
jgi:2-keto-4-pentenoate hydratase